jgi:CHAT domain-containing protein
VIVADPDFGVGPAGAQRDIQHSGSASPAPTSVDLARVMFTPLPGTAEEAAAISRLMKAQVLSRGEATEAALKQIHAPGILHIATHGFFLETVVPIQSSAHVDRELVLAPQTEVDGLPDDPLLRSGLGLAGANARRSGKGEDGLLTAAEATGLNLWGTKLVVLSACNTGVGEVRTGDGVYGLRRAFVLAGAETTLMIGFYQKLLAGASRGEALRQTQLEMLGNPARRHPFYWASFIQSGAWGTL